MLKREARLHALTHELMAMNDELLGILEAVEWHQQRYNGSPACPCCGAQQHWGHDQGCELAIAIGVPASPEKPEQPQDADSKEGGK